MGMQNTFLNTTYTECLPVIFKNWFKCGKSIEIINVIFMKNVFVFYIDEVTHCLTRAPQTSKLCCIEVDPFPLDLLMNSI